MLHKTAAPFQDFSGGSRRPHDARRGDEGAPLRRELRSSAARTAPNGRRRRPLARCIISRRPPAPSWPPPARPVAARRARAVRRGRRGRHRARRSVTWAAPAGPGGRGAGGRRGRRARRAGRKDDSKSVAPLASSARERRATWGSSALGRRAAGGPRPRAAPETHARVPGLAGALVNCAPFVSFGAASTRETRSTWASSAWCPVCS